MIEVRKLKRINLPAGGDWEIVATFDAAIGDFRVRGGSLRRSSRNGVFEVSVGAPRTGVRLTLPDDCDTRRNLLAAVLEAYDGRS